MAKDKMHDVRSGIRTHAHRSGLRPERSALDRSAILTLMKGRVNVGQNSKTSYDP